MRTLLAFDKFKDSLSANDACIIAADTLRSAHPTWHFDACPLTDGGEGFVEIITSAAHGQFIDTRVAGPLGTPVNARFGLVSLSRIPPAARALLDLPATIPADASIAIIEMAAASGLALLAPDRRDPWQTTTFGTGELILAATHAGAAAILLGIGGSATNDLGLGALAALGLEFHTAENETISPPIPAAWNRIATLAGSPPPHLPPIRIACDVTNPLLGPRGCAAIYGPQKGLRPADLPRLEHASARLADLLCTHFAQPDSLVETPGAGAAGGISFGLMTATDARLLPGFALVSAWLDLDARIAAADLILTGEGRFDESSLDGKGPGAVVARARALGRNIHVFAGAIPPAANPLTFHAITPADTPLATALRTAPDRLRAALVRQFPS